MGRKLVSYYTAYRTCGRCKGSGFREFNAPPNINGSFLIRMECSRCEGTGVVRYRVDAAKARAAYARRAACRVRVPDVAR